MDAGNELQDIRLRPEPPRNRWGQPLIVPPDGGKAKALIRATTVAGTCDDGHSLTKWKIRTAAMGLVSRPDLLAQVAAHQSTDKKVLDDVCQQAIDAAAGSAGANLGTALHKMTERVDLNPDTVVPEMFADHVDAYTTTLKAHGITVDLEYVERMHVLWSLGIAGTPDRHLLIDGVRYIGDLKTGSSIEYGQRDFATQLAIYANSETTYDPATETHQPVPDINTERGIIIHLPSERPGECTLHWINLKEGWKGVQLAMQVRGWRKQRDLLHPFTTLPAVADEPAPEPEPEPVAEPEPEPKPAAKTPRKRAPKKLPPRIEPVTPPTDPGPGLIEREGGYVTDDQVEHIRARATGDVGERVRQWVIEARDAQHPVNMGGGLHTVRRWNIAATATTLAEHDDTDDDGWVRAMLAICAGETAYNPDISVGELLGSLNEHQCTLLRTIAEDGDYMVAIADDGRISITP